MTKVKKIGILPQWCLGTLRRMSDKEEKVPIIIIIIIINQALI